MEQIQSKSSRFYINSCERAKNVCSYAWTNNLSVSEMSGKVYSEEGKKNTKPGFKLITCGTTKNDLISSSGSFSYAPPSGMD